MPKIVKTKVSIPTDEMMVVIRKNGKNPVRHEAWRYYSILDTLRWFGADRDTAAEIAKWCGRTHEELSKTTGEITVELKWERKE